MAIESGAPITTLAGLHIGCIELIAKDQFRSLSDFNHVSVAVGGASAKTLVSLIAGYIGLDPEQDIEWAFAEWHERVDMLDRGEVDVVLAIPPVSYSFHDKKIGHVILNTTTDDPWRNYLCCMVIANQEFVSKHPIATKRALRAVLKANRLCALEPQRVAKIIDNEFRSGLYNYALSMFRDIPYGAWREYDPEDSFRFFSLRLRDVGIVKKSPEQLIALGTDFRFLNELKQELKV